MELFTDDVSFIEKQINYLKEQIHHGYNLEDKSSIIYSLQVLDCISYCLTNKTNLTKKTCRNKDIVIKVNTRDRKMHNKNLDNFIENKDEHLSLVNCVFNDNKDICIPILDEYLEEEFLSDEEMYEIMSDYFLSANDMIGYETLKKTVEENKMYMLELDNFSCSGITFLNTFLNDFRVIIDEATISNSIGLMTTIMHEIGHVIDYTYLRNNLVYYSTKSIFIETLSSMYEKDFLDYLIRNSIYKRKAIERITDFYGNMYDELNSIALSCNIPDRLLRREKYKKITREKLYRKVSEEAELLVPLEEFPLPQSIDVLESLKYGYGEVLATYFLRLKKTDYDKYQDEFSKFMELRTDYFPKNFLEKIGTKQNTLAQTVDEEIMDSPCKIMIKK